MTEPRRFRLEDFLRARVAAEAAAPGIEWHTASRDYGWCFELTGSIVIDGEQQRFAFEADQAYDSGIREQVAAAESMEAFIDAWTTRKARALAERLNSTTE